MKRKQKAAVAPQMPTAPGVAPAQPDVVRQSELQHIIDLENEAAIKAFAIRKRLRAGAVIEPGSLDAHCDFAESIERFEENYESEIRGLNGHVNDIAGLTVAPAIEVARHAASMALHGHTVTRW
jgi:hypothetical protein